MNLNIFVDAFEEINNKMKAMNETQSEDEKRQGYVIFLGTLL